MVLPASKGNTTVVMDKTDYTGKLEDLLRNDSYNKVPNNENRRNTFANPNQEQRPRPTLDSQAVVTTYMVSPKFTKAVFLSGHLLAAKALCATLCVAYMWISLKH